ncbi:uncharacterized protein LOC112508949 [Cynara cardunculus var. scolymus]|uniref:uncharacterized protein LOC112508949 n=1 Tax=Cynara cardunculus var. scolymus TaxID=59895 RepID=UPI000D62C23D|nr:uncharacterized protein LOC112508949 [Cynara cardunculus var. scolymus]
MVGGSSTRKEEVPRARVKAFQITAEEAWEEPDLVTGIFFVNSHSARILFDSGSMYSFVSHAFVRFLESVHVLFDRPFSVDTASGTPLVADRVFNDCTLVLEDQNFSVDLILMDIRGFDVVIGMDWLVANRADIICVQRMIRIPVSEGDYVYVYEKKGSVTSRNKLAKDVPVVCEFQDVFPDDLLGLPPDRQVEFRIDNVPGAAPIARTPYRLAPT